MAITRRANRKRGSKSEDLTENDTRSRKRAKKAPDFKEQNVGSKRSTEKNKGKGKMTSSVHAPNVDLEQNVEINDDSDEDSFDWETVEIPVEQDIAFPLEENKPVYNDVEIVMETPRPVLKKSHWERAYQRNLREWVHHSHVVTLIAHYKIRNKWCSDKDMKSVCASILPENAKRLLSKDSFSEDALKTGIKWLTKWWSEFFKLTGPGLLTIPYHELDKKYRGHQSLEAWIGSHESDEYGDYIEDIDAFMALLVSKSATRDTCAELFVALLRSCGCDARLVCSLQPVPYRIPSSTPTDDKKMEMDKDVEDRKPLFQYRANNRAYVDPNIQLKSQKAKPPTVWAEVYAKDTQKWITVDPIRGVIDKPLMMEPPNLDRSNSLSYVLAFDKKGRITDVTRRYTSNMEKALKLRERPLTKREMEGGIKLWSDILLQAVCHKPKMSERDHMEQQELEQRLTREVMPTSLSGFKNHPVYALERHLLKYEVIYPKDLVLGSIRGEKIYPRSSVKTVSTAETYRKSGRQIKPGEQPVKIVKANAFTIEKRRMKELAKQEGGDYSVPCYGEWQTEPYIPPPVIDGVLPKNSFGNIELFTASMLPEGAAHIQIKGIGKLAKKLGIDYADAVVDFEFVKMRAVPVYDGIVVAESSKEILLEAWEDHEQDQAVRAIEKHEKEVYARWRKLIKGLLIKARIDREYGKSDEKTIEQKWSKFSRDSDKRNGMQESNIGGGFIADDEDDTSTTDRKASPVGGGFLIDEDMEDFS